MQLVNGSKPEILPTQFYQGVVDNMRLRLLTASTSRISTAKAASEDASTYKQLYCLILSYCIHIHVECWCDHRRWRSGNHTSVSTIQTWWKNSRYWSIQRFLWKFISVSSGKVSIASSGAVRHLAIEFIVFCISRQFNQNSMVSIQSVSQFQSSINNTSRWRLV